MAKTLKDEINQIQKDFLRAKGVRKIDELTGQEKIQLQDLINSEMEYDEEIRQAQIAPKMNAVFKTEHDNSTVQSGQEAKTLTGYGWVLVVGGSIGAITCFIIGQPVMGIGCIGIIALRWFFHRR